MRSVWRKLLWLAVCLVLLFSAQCALATGFGPPTGLVAVSQGSSQITLSWQPVVYAIYYRVYQGTGANSLKRINATTQTTSMTLTGLNPNTTYYFKVTAVRDLEESGYSNLAYAKTAAGLPAPQGVKAAATNGEIDVFWNAVAGAGGYAVYRSETSSGPYVRIGTTMSNILAYSDDPVPPNKIAYFKVRAMNGAGEGTFSAYVSARTPPTAPTVPVVKALSTSSVRISWGAVPGATRYRVYRQNLSTGLFDRIAEPTKPAYVDSGLASGVYRHYKLAAVNAGGEGPLSDPFWALLLPGVPANVAAWQADAATVHVEWDASSSADQYRLYRATSPSGPFQVYYLNNDTFFNDAGLLVGQTGYYKVSAVNQGGEGAVSKVVSAKRAPGPASAPGSPKATALSSSAIKLNWSAVPNATYYTVVLALSPSGPFSPAGSPTTTSYICGSLKANTTYYFKVLPFNAADMGPSTGVFSRKTKAAAPAQPAGFAAAAEGGSAIRLSWRTSGAASGYRVYRYNPATKKYALITDVPNLFFVDLPLTPATAYKYQLSAYNAYGESAHASVTCRTSETTLTPPTGLTVSAHNFQTIDVSFNAVSGASSYVVYCAKTPSSDLSAYQAVPCTATGVRLGGLKPGTAYCFRVAAVDAGNKAGQPSDIAAAQTPAAPAKPSMPKFYLVTSVLQGDDVKLVFGHPGNNDYPSQLDSTFEVYVASSRAKLASAKPQVYDATAIMTEPGCYATYTIPYGEARWFGFRACFGPYKSDMQVVNAAALARPVLGPIQVDGASLTLQWQNIVGAPKYAVYISAEEPSPLLSWYESKAQLTATGKLSFKGFSTVPTITLNRLTGASTMYYIVVPVSQTGMEGWYFGVKSYHLTY